LTAGFRQLLDVGKLVILEPRKTDLRDDARTLSIIIKNASLSITTLSIEYVYVKNLFTSILHECL
jgi:hypothetical protein